MAKRKLKRPGAYKKEAKLAHEMWLSEDPYYSIEEIGAAHELTGKQMNARISYWRSKIPGWFAPRNVPIESKSIDEYKKEAELAHAMWLSEDPYYSTADIGEAYNMSDSQMRSRLNYWRSKIPGWFTVRPRRPKIKPVEQFIKEASVAQQMWDSEDPTYSIEDIAAQYGLTRGAMSRQIARWREKIPGAFEIKERGKAASDYRKDAALAQQMWDEGATVSEIAQKYGYGTSYMSIKLGRWREKIPGSFQKRPRGKTIEQYEKESALAKEMWESESPRYSYKEIAAAHGVPVDQMKGRISFWRTKMPGSFPLRKFRKGRSYYAEESVLAQEMWAAGKSVEDIAAAYGIKPPSMKMKIGRWREKMPKSFPIRQRGFSQDRYKEDAYLAYKMWLAGFDLANIAKAYQTKKDNINKRLQRYRKLLGWFQRSEHGYNLVDISDDYNSYVPLKNIAKDFDIPPELISNLIPLHPRVFMRDLDIEDVFYRIFNGKAIKPLAKELKKDPYILARWLYLNLVYDNMLSFNKSVMKDYSGDRPSLIERANRLFGIESRDGLTRLISTWGTIQDLVLEKWPDMKLPIPNPLQSIINKYLRLGLYPEEIEVLLGIDLY